jgi:hypothetical protein
MGTAWVYVINQGIGVPKIQRRSHTGITVTQSQTGVYVVTFPVNVQGLAAVATLGNSVGTITAVPGENAGLPPNHVTVSTVTLQNQAGGAYDFSLAVFYNERWWWPWVVGAVLAAAAATLVLRSWGGG